MAQRIVDLSLTIEDNMPAHKLFQRPVIALHMSHENTKALNLGVPGDAMTFQTNFIARWITWEPMSTPTAMSIRTARRSTRCRLRPSWEMPSVSISGIFPISATSPRRIWKRRKRRPESRWMGTSCCFARLP